MRETVVQWQGYHIMVYSKSEGEGRIPLVLLHGGGVDSALLSWREVMALLPDEYAMYAIDLPGYGQSDRPEGMEGVDFYPRLISALETVADYLGLRQFVLSGLSMGGAVAIGYALRHPERVSALIPVDTWGLVHRMPLHRLLFVCVNTSWLQASFRLFAKHRWLVRWTVTASLIGDRARATPALVDEVLSLCRVPNAEASMRDFQRSSLTKTAAIPDYTGQWSNLPMPVLFINGEKDSLVKTADAARAAKAVPRGHLHVLRGCRHWAQKEKPEEYVRVVDALVREQGLILA